MANGANSEVIRGKLHSDTVMQLLIQRCRVFVLKHVMIDACRSLEQFYD